jgi:hypothetical protein
LNYSLKIKQNFKHRPEKGSESNFDVAGLCADVMVVLNLNPTPISLPLLVEASLDRQPSNERLLFSPGGAREGGG